MNITTEVVAGYAIVKGDMVKATDGFFYTVTGDSAGGNGRLYLLLEDFGRLEVQVYGKNIERLIAA